MACLWTFIYVFFYEKQINITLLSISKKKNEMYNKIAKSQFRIVWEIKTLYYKGQSWT